MNLDFLMTFITVVNEQSFTRAGQIRHLSAPAVMNQINALEQETGFQLLKRTNRGVFPTPEGNAFFKDAEKMVEIYRESLMKNRILQFFASQESIRIGVSPLVPVSKVNASLSHFFRFHSNIRLSVTFFDRSIDKISDLSKQLENVNLIIRAFDFYDMETQFSCIPFGNTLLCLKVPFSHELSERSEISIRDLKKQNIMIIPEGSGPVYDRFRHDIEKMNQGNTLYAPESIHGYDMINECLKNNSIMVSLEEFAEYVPFMSTVKLTEKYIVPFGIVLSPAFSVAAQTMEP